MKRLAPLLLLSTAYAAVGDPCPDRTCPPTEICVPDDDGDYCTTRCDAGAACPEGYYCRPTDLAGVSLCLNELPPEPVGLGDACGPDVFCADGLFCGQGSGEGEAYCTQSCTVAGSCPAGYACVGQDDPACSRLSGPPGFGEPCAEGNQCAEGLTCAADASGARALPFCTHACNGGCPGGWHCTGDLCAPDARPKPGYGQRCTASGADANVVGCAEGLFCRVERPESYCTRECSTAEDCPAAEGIELGCATRDGESLCRRNIADDVPDHPPPVPIPDGGFPAIDAATPPTGADGGVDDDDDGGGGGGGGGCGFVPGRPVASGWVLLLAVGLVRRRR